MTDIWSDMEWLLRLLVSVIKVRQVKLVKAREVVRIRTKQLKLFTNFSGIPSDYHLISWVTNYAHNLGVF